MQACAALRPDACPRPCRGAAGGPWGGAPMTASGGDARILGVHKNGEGLVMSGPAQYGTPEAIREYIAEVMWFAGRLADLAQSFAELGDDIGLEYVTRRMVAYLKAALG